MNESRLDKTKTLGDISSQAEIGILYWVKCRNKVRYLVNSAGNQAGKVFFSTKYMGEGIAERRGSLNRNEVILPYTVSKQELGGIAQGNNTNQ